MTRYEQGFLTKCAEYGLDTDTSMKLMKKQALVGGLAGYFTQRDDPDAINASVAGNRAIKPGALWGGGVSALSGLLQGGLPGALLRGAIGAGSGALTGYLGGRLAGHRNEKDRKNGVKGVSKKKNK